jgi:hypothetical protein
MNSGISCEARQDQKLMVRAAFRPVNASAAQLNHKDTKNTKKHK